MKVSEVVRLLKKAGCYIYRNGSNHDIWLSPKTGKKFPVSRHQTEELKPKTLESIKKDSGCDPEPFLEILEYSKNLLLR